MVNSSKVDRFLDSFQAAPLVRQVERLEYMGEGGVMPAYSLDRGLQVQETVLLGFKKQLEFSFKVWCLTKGPIVYKFLNKTGKRLSFSCVIIKSS
jgi:hypothetical protein